jgi:beta-glucosidase
VYVDDTIVARVRLTNTGTRPAVKTVQAYLSDLVTSVTWARQELKGFTGVEIESGASVEVRLEIPVALCTIVTSEGRRIVEPGEFELRVGPSSVASKQLTARFRVG